MTTGANISGQCVPLSQEDAEHEARERQTHDQNRCPLGCNLVDMDGA
jgi:hypothetical protein